MGQLGNGHMAPDEARITYSTLRLGMVLAQVYSLKGVFIEVPQGVRVRLGILRLWIRAPSVHVAIAAVWKH